MHPKRIFRHLVLPHWWLLRPFPKAALRAIEQAVKASEKQHLCELRVVVEAHLPIAALLHGQTTRARAIALFSELRVWDTEDNSCVLLYVQLADRRVEIVADRGIHARVGDSFWNGVCRRLEAAFRAGRFAAGTHDALDEITRVLVEHFPADGADNPDELPDAPLVR